MKRLTTPILKGVLVSYQVTTVGEGTTRPFRRGEEGSEQWGNGEAWNKKKMTKNINPKKFTKDTLRTGNKERIIKVLNHYWAYCKKERLYVKQKREEDIVAYAEELFNGQTEAQKGEGELPQSDTPEPEKMQML